MSTDTHIDPDASTPHASGDSADTIKVSDVPVSDVPVNQLAITISIPTVGTNGETDHVIVTIPLCEPAGPVEVARVPGAAGIQVDTIKVSGAGG